MNLKITEEQQVLLDSFRKFFEVESSMARVRAAEPVGFDPRMWRSLAQMGALSMRLPDDDAAQRFSLFDATLVMEQAGRQLASGPLAETMVAIALLANLGQTGPILLAACNGTEILTLALRDVRESAAQIVPAGAIADRVLFLAGEEVFIASQNPARRSPRNLGSMPLATVTLTGEGAAPAILIARGPAARRAYLAALEEWKLLTAANLTGLSRKVVELASDYAKTRLQFGRPIGSFQAIAHPLADLFTDITGSTMLNRWALQMIADGDPAAAAAVSMSWWWAARTSGAAAARGLHTFGGYGVTNEYDIQLYHRRAKAVALLWGEPRDELLEAGRRLWLGYEVPLPEVGPLTIEFGLGQRAESLAAETRAFFERTLTPLWRAKAHYSLDSHDWELYRAIAAAGLLFPTWPTEHRGRGATTYVAAAALTVWHDFGVTTHAQGVSNMVGQVVMQFGSDLMKREVLPRIAAGDIIMCLGYSEPASGSDVFAAQTKAERDGVGWRINGQKIFTTGADLASYVLLLTRTNQGVPKHSGITLFLVPLNDPGIAIHPIHTFQEERTNATFYTHVYIPDEYRVGPVDGGLGVLSWALKLEQGGGSFVDQHRHVLEAAVAWARNAKRSGRAAIEDPRVLERLAQVAVHVKVSQLIFWRSLWLSEQEIPDRSAGPMSKLFSSEAYLRDATDMLDLAAPDTLLHGKHALGTIELSHRHASVTTIYAGTSEVHRSQIAENALGLPKSR
jgi:3-oxochol-4-en-24-oyl-CoA dehydrogenase